MGGSKGSYLGQVGDADHLALMTAHLVHDLRHLLGNFSAHTRIDLVEDDGGQFHGPADHRLQGEHHTGDLTTRSHLRHRLEWGGGVGREEIGHLVLTIGRQTFLGDADLETDIRHPQGNEPLLHLFLYGLRGLRAQFRQCISLLLTLCLQLRHLLLSLPQGLVAVVKILQLLLQRIPLCYQRLGIFCMVFLLQVVETVQTFVHGVEFRRIKVHVVHQSAYLAGDILQFDIGAVHPCGQLLGLGQHASDAFQRIHRTAQLCHDTRLICLQSIVGLVEGTLDLFRVGHRLTLLFQFLLLAWLQTGICQFLILELQKIHILSVALYLFLQRFQFVGSLVIGIIALLIGCQLLGVVGNDVEHAHLEILLVQQQVLVLGVYIHKSLTQFLEHR